MISMVFYIVFGLFDGYWKGEIEIISGSVQYYVFLNVFEVVLKLVFYEKVVVGKNFEYVIEVLWIDGQLLWFVCVYDEFMIQMDGEVWIDFIKFDYLL